MDNPEPVRRRRLPSRALLCCAVVMTVGAGPQLPSAGPAAATYRQLVDDYRHQNAASLPRAGALTETEIRAFVDDALNAHGHVAAMDAGRPPRRCHAAHGCVSVAPRVGQTAAAFAHLNAAIAPGRGAPRSATARRGPFANLWYQKRQRDADEGGRAGVGKRPHEALATRARVFGGGGGVRTGTGQGNHGLRGQSRCPRGRVRPEAVPTLEGRGRRFRGSPGPGRFTAQGRAAPGTIPSPDGRARRRPAMARGGHAVPRSRATAISRSCISGSIEEQEGRVEQAEARYRAATAAFPWGQSGPLALARLLSRTNREADARAVVSTDAGAAVDARSIHSGPTSRDPEASPVPSSI